MRIQIPEEALRVGKVDAVDQRVVSADQSRITEQLIFEADLKSSVAIRAWPVHRVNRCIAGQIAEEGIAAIGFGRRCRGCCRSEERRVGKECGSTCRTRGS